MAEEVQQPNGDSVKSAEEKSSVAGHVLHGIEDSVSKLDKALAESASKLALARDASAAEGSNPTLAKVARIAKPIGIAGLAVSGVVSAVHIGYSIKLKEYEEAVETGAGFVAGLEAAILMGEVGASLGALTGPAAPFAVPVLTLAAGIAGGFIGEKLAKKLVHEAHEFFHHLESHAKEWFQKLDEKDPVRVDEKLTEQFKAEPILLGDIGLKYETAKAEARDTLDLGLACGMDAALLSKNFVTALGQAQQEAAEAIQSKREAKALHFPEVTETQEHSITVTA